MAGDTIAVARPVRLALPVRPVVTTALTVTGCCTFVVLIGLFGQFADRWLVVSVLDIGHALLLAIALSGGASLARRVPGWGAVIAAALAGAISGGLLELLVDGARLANLRWMLVALTPVTLNRVGFLLPDQQAFLMLAVSGAVAAALGASIVLAPVLVRRVMLGVLIGV